MTEDQYKALDDAKKIDLPFYLTVGLFSNDFSDRTLLYGYDCDRVTWHLYVEDGDVKLTTVDGAEGIREPLRQNLSREPVTRSHLQSAIIPNKRLYPERCDYDFCVWAKEEGLHLSFTTFDASRAVKNGDYFGEI